VDQNSGSIAEGVTLRDGAQHMLDTYGDIGAEEVLRGQLVADDRKTPLSIEEAANRVGNAEAFLERINRDPEFRKQLLSGSQDHRELFEKATATITAGRTMLERHFRGY
jgi:hypothetical protein